MNGLPNPISVVAPIQPAIDRARDMLFRPFQLAKWFPIGFCAWLAGFGGGGAGFNFGMPFPRGPLSGLSGGQAVPSPSVGSATEWWQEVQGEVMRNLYWIVPLAVALVCLSVALALVAVWLTSRGQFMFLHCVALDRSEVAVPWRRHAGAARSLFLFRVVVGLIGVVPALILLAAFGISLYRIIGRGDNGSWPLLIVAGLALFLVGLVFAIVDKLTRDLVVPIMFLRGGTCREAWRELLGLYAGRAGGLVVYLLFQIVLGLVVGAIILAAMVATCCLLGCLLLLPYIGTVALLPILIFQRSYSLYYLRQFGPRYDVFQPAAVAAPTGPA